MEEGFVPAAQGEAQLGQFPGQVVGVGGAGLGHLFQAPGAHGGQVDRGGHGAQGLVGADVGGGLLPADVLFPGLEGEDKAPAAFGVGGLAHDAAGELAHHGLLSRS